MWNRCESGKRRSPRFPPLNQRIKFKRGFNYHFSHSWRTFTKFRSYRSVRVHIYTIILPSPWIPQLILTKLEAKKKTRFNRAESISHAITRYGNSRNFSSLVLLPPSLLRFQSNILVIKVAKKKVKSEGRRGASERLGSITDAVTKASADDTF